MRLYILVLSVLLAAPFALSQPDTSAYAPLPIAFSQTLSLPGEESAAPPLGVIRSTHQIVQGDASFGATISEVLALTEAEDHAGHSSAVQAVSGIGLRWALRNATEWVGNEAAVGQLVAIHAAHGGIMYAEMVQTHDLLVWHLPEDRVQRLRDQIVAAYQLRLENPCDECTDDNPLAFVIDPDSFSGLMQERVQVEADAHRAALSTIAGWAGGE